MTRVYKIRYLSPLLLSGILVFSCGDSAEPGPIIEEPIIVGAALPFSGPRASTGIQLERALMLAVEDVNRLGGVQGRPLQLIVRDSNSGSERGLTTIRSLLENDEVKYLIGPEEDELSVQLVRDIKANDVMQIIPAVTAPEISDSGSNGAWLRLTPSAYVMGCALATKAAADQVESTRTIAARDDYHLELSAAFASAFGTLGGSALPTVSVKDGEFSYEKAVRQINRFEADATLMLTYPATAATIIKEMGRSGQETRWYFSPMLRDDALLWNLPKGALTDAVGFSPTLSTDEECDYVAPTLSNGGAPPVQGDDGRWVYPDGGFQLELQTDIECSSNTASRFVAHYSERWGQLPLKSAHFYYDAVILLALGLEVAEAEGVHQPRPRELLEFIAEDKEGAKEVPWDQLEEALERAENREPLRYVGAAGEYMFDDRGQNIRTIIDTWVVNGEHRFVERESVACAYLGEFTR